MRGPLIRDAYYTLRRHRLHIYTLPELLLPARYYIISDFGKATMIYRLHCEYCIKLYIVQHNIVKFDILKYIKELLRLGLKY